MSPRRIKFARWQVAVLHTPRGPVELRVHRDDPNEYVDLDVTAPDGMRIEVRPLPVGERPPTNHERSRSMA